LVGSYSEQLMEPSSGMPVPKLEYSYESRLPLHEFENPWSVHEQVKLIAATPRFWQKME
jgi:hypothetical protein